MGEVVVESGAAVPDRIWAEVEVADNTKDALTEGPGSWEEEKACSLPIIPMEIKKGKSHPLGDKEAALGVCELGAASPLWGAQTWVLMLLLCR